MRRELISQVKTVSQPLTTQTCKGGLNGYEDIYS
jgi:hypothetical protein